MIPQLGGTGMEGRLSPDALGTFGGRAAAAWRAVLLDGRLRWEAAATLVLLPLVIGSFSVFATWNDGRREGWSISDPILSVIEPRNLTMPLSVTIAGVILAAVAGLLTRPVRLLRTLQAYEVLLCLRIVTLFLVPLEPPSDMIHLDDPVVRWITGSTWRRDLFFSGHVSTLFLTALAYVDFDRRFARLLLACTALVAVGLLWQHAHYSIDVAAAPLAAWASVWLVAATHRRTARAH